MREEIEKLRFEQLTKDEERQRLRADAAEKYKQQLENFMDMICHEIRNPYGLLLFTHANEVLGSMVFSEIQISFSTIWRALNQFY